MKKPAPPNKPFHRRRWIWVIVGVTALLGIVSAGGNHWVTRKIESVAGERLHERGLTGEWKNASWTLWNGLSLEHLTIRHRESGRLLVQSDNLNVRFPISQFLHGGERHASWHIRNADVILGDEMGEIPLTHVNIEAESAGQHLVFRRMDALKDGLSVSLKGDLTLKPPKDPPPSEFIMNLSIVRATLGLLDFRAGGDLFKVQGNFSVNASTPEISWSTNLAGAGSNLDWKGIKLTQGNTEAHLSSAESKIEAAFVTAHGSIRGAASRDAWKTTPLAFEGVLQDQRGGSDTFSGRYENQTLEIAQLKGSANLVEIGQDIPQLTGKLQAVQFEKFPELDVRDIHWNREAGWKVGSARVIGGSTAATFKMEDRRVEVTGLSGTASYGENAWAFKDLRAKVFGGGISVDGNYRDGQLKQATIEADGLRLSQIKNASVGSARKRSPAVLSGSYRGSVRFDEFGLTGKGSLLLENAPVFDVPLLDQVYDLFAALIPGIERSKQGRFEANFTSKDQLAEVTYFKATGGSLTVSAKGTVNLAKETVSGRARGKLDGLPGLVTSPLSRLLEMEVSGPFKAIRVKPLGPAKLVSNAISGTVGEVVETFQEPGKITEGLMRKGIKVPMRFMKKDGDGDRTQPDDR